MDSCINRLRQALIHLDRLTHNLRLLQVQVGERSLWPVIKANAYGHGAELGVPMVRALSPGAARGKLMTKKTKPRAPFRVAGLVAPHCHEDDDGRFTGSLAFYQRRSRPPPEYSPEYK